MGPLFDWYGNGDVEMAPGDPERPFRLSRASVVGGQAFAAGLVDAVELAVAPVVLGSGVRFFGSYAGPHRLLENPDSVVRGDRVAHLDHRVRC